MGKNITNQLMHVKEALLKLESTGDKGFEGLIAKVLTKISKIPFRMAASGSQHGIDAKSVYDDDAVSFEAKRYSKLIPKKEVLSKIAELSIECNHNIDLWILGATTSVSTQLSDSIRDTSAQLGVATLILDWSEVALPPLAVALAEAKDETIQFLKLNIKDLSMVTSVRRALNVISNHESFNEEVVRLRNQLLEPTIGAGLFKHANKEWINQVFSSRTTGRHYLGQALSPKDNPHSITLDRNYLIDSLRPFFTLKPDGNIVVVHGGEGTGKSWLVAQSWLSLEEKPLMLILTPKDFNTTNPRDEIEQILLNKLIQQTNDDVSELKRIRWNRRMKYWTANKEFDKPNLIIFLDGINQRPEIDWALNFETLGAYLEKIGGKLIVTSRTAYYRNSIERRLICQTKEILVNEWTESELDQILTNRGIHKASITPSVQRALKNPRLLGISLELLSTEQIESLQELNVSWILFEHIRIGERESPDPQPIHEFVRILQEHADDILSRIETDQEVDLTVFDNELKSVAHGRFFRSLDEDPTRYKLDEDGLTLAIGFSIINSLHISYRNSKNLDETLQNLLDPISALDKTADALIAALVISFKDTKCPTEFASVLIVNFLQLQNPNSDNYNTFIKFARNDPKPYLSAAYSLFLKESYLQNLEWLKQALLDARSDNHAWQVISEHIQLWLSHVSYSLEDSRDPYSSESEKNDRINIRKDDIQKSLDNLSPAELNILNSMNEVESSNLNSLSGFAFMLLKSKPLSKFASGFLHWCIASVINPYNSPPYEQFINLVRLNEIDWKDTYISIHHSIKVLEDNDISDTGKWTLVYLLRATGEIEDGKKAEKIAKILTANQSKINNWRLIEDYCNTDPCDPNSIKPPNISNTKERCNNLDESSLSIYSSLTEEDHFLDMASTGLARFESKTIIKKYRDLASDIVKRNGWELWYGILKLRDNCALLDKDIAIQLLNQSQILANNSDEVGDNNEIGVAREEYGVLVAFPHLTGHEQFQILCKRNSTENLLLETLRVLKPLRKDTLDKYIEDAIEKSSDHVLICCLTFAYNSDTPISSNLRKLLPTLIKSPNRLVRLKAIALILKISDKKLIKAFADSEWSAQNLGFDESYSEVWYGSELILRSAELGYISEELVLGRISPKFFGRASIRLGQNVAKMVFNCIDNAIKKTAGIELDIPLLDIEQNISDSEKSNPPLYTVTDQKSISEDPLASIESLVEDRKAFKNRQERNHESFRVFQQRLTSLNIQHAVDNFSTDEFRAIISANNKILDEWYEIIINLPTNKLRFFSNIGLLIARQYGTIDPEKSRNLYSLLKDLEPYIRFTLGRESTPMDSISLWSGDDDPSINQLRFERIDKAGNDDQISIEVLSAFRNSKDKLIQDYVNKKISVGEPSMIARALMVCGFSLENENVKKILDEYKDTSGFIGLAHESAMYAYERNIWAKKWFDNMCKTSSNQKFWSNSILFSKIVDARFVIWSSNYNMKGKPIKVFGATINNRINRRIKKWRDKRKKTLFGGRIT